MSMVHDPGDTGFVELMQLFREELSSVQFPGADVGVLEEAQSWVDTCREDVAQCEAALERARDGLAQAHDVRLRKAQRALSYARIYAEEDGELLARLAAVVLPRHRLTPGGVGGDPMMFGTDGEPTQRAPSGITPRRRGRPARGESPQALLGPTAAVASADNTTTTSAPPSRELLAPARVHKVDNATAAADAPAWGDLAAVI